MSKKRKRTNESFEKQNIDSSIAVLYLSGHGAQNVHEPLFKDFPEFKQPEIHNKSIKKSRISFRERILGLSGKQIPEYEMLSYVIHYGEYGLLHCNPIDKSRKTLGEIELCICEDLLKFRNSGNGQGVFTPPITNNVGVRKSPKEFGAVQPDKFGKRQVKQAWASYGNVANDKSLQNISIKQILLNAAIQLKKLYNRVFPGVQKFITGFRFVTPQRERLFWFEPNMDEGDEWRAHYGIHGLHFEHNNINHPLLQLQASNHPRLDVTIQDSFDFGNLTYRTIYFIKNNKLMLESINNYVNDVDDKNRCHQIYSNMCQPHAPPTSLSEILYLFSCIGFKKIYLIDPTCRHICGGPSASILMRRLQTDKVHSDNLEERKLLPEVVISSKSKETPSTSASSVYSEKMETEKEPIQLCDKPIPLCYPINSWLKKIMSFWKTRQVSGIKESIKYTGTLKNTRIPKMNRTVRKLRTT